MTARARNFASGMLVGAGLVYSLGRKHQRGHAVAVPTVESKRYGSRIGDIAGLEAATLESSSRGGRRLAALMLRLVGGALVVHGFMRRGRLGRVTRTIGLGMLARKGRPARSARPEARQDRRRVVDIQKTLHIDAPVHQVYAFWNNYENFPLFMSNVREVVDLGGGRSHWSVRGPGGASIRWDARLTEQIPNQVIAWHSEPGAMLENAGAIRFQPEGAGTRIDLRFCYRPPASGAGRAVAELLGADPRAKLNEDLGRLKALLEGMVRSESYGQRSGA